MGYVSREVIDTYMNRTLCDSERAKRFSNDALCAKLNAMQPVPLFYTQPRRHQQIGFLLGAQYPRYLFFFDPGLGKSKLVCDLVNYRVLCGQPSKTLVLVPNTSNVPTWRKELEKHAPNLTFGSIEDEGGVLDGDADLVCMTFASFLRLTSDKVLLEKENLSEKDQHKLKPSDAKIALFAKRFQVLVVDESQNIKNHLSTTYKAVSKLSKFVVACYALTGTPFGRNPEDLWSQFFAVDRGETLGTTLGIFRAAFFTEKDDYWSGTTYEFVKSRTDDLRRMIRHRSLRVIEEECEDLPPLTKMKHEVVFSKETWSYYDRLVEEMTAARGDFRVVDNVYHRMRQLTSGWLGVKDPESENYEIKFKNNPKLEALLGMLDELPEHRKVLIINEYTVTGDILCSALKAKKIPHLRLYGATKNKPEVLDRFERDPSIRALVMNHKSGAAGLNLQHATYELIYESPTSPIIRKQLEKRIHRTGQRHHTFIWDFVVKGSIDERVLALLEEGRDLYECLMGGDMSLVGGRR